LNALRTAAVVFLAALTGGCGTVCNFVGGIFHPDREPRPFGGVQRDAAFLSQMGGSVQASGDGWALLAYLGLLFADFPLSFVGDALTLPLANHINRKREEAYNGGKVVPADRPLGPASLGPPRPFLPAD
jgi:uncharacterized protein YceK